MEVEEELVRDMNDMFIGDSGITSQNWGMIFSYSFQWGAKNTWEVDIYYLKLSMSSYYHFVGTQ